MCCSCKSQFILGAKRYQLDIDVSTLSFTHHSLFSKEHVLASKLQQLYTQYCTTMKKSLVNHLTGKVGLAIFCGLFVSFCYGFKTPSLYDFNYF